MGHLGLTPQSVHQLGGFRAQGKTATAAKRLLEELDFRFPLRLGLARCLLLLLPVIVVVMF
jgi:ketopantoate hydroxymethyltransferase